MDNISPDSLDWALKHIDKYGDTNIFPRPFEIDAIKANWSAVKTELSHVDLDSYSTRAVIRALAPKGGRLLRVTHQLDPLDALIYTAVVHEASSTIEDGRIAEADHVACSYRIHTDSSGSFFANGNGWSDYHAKSRELLESGDFSFVFLADVTDCYNQLYHHRIQNSVETASIPLDRSKNIEKLLSSFTAKQSRGLPVGPLASIVLAEICLNDIDTMLLRKGRKFVRYVDDYRVFCRTKGEAVAVMHELTDYLYTAHRLSLQFTKSRMVPIEEFLKHELVDPEEDENNKKNAELKRIIEEILETTGYEVDVADIPDPTQKKIVMSNLAELMQMAIGRSFDERKAKYVLARATSLRSRSILPIVLSNLKKLLPVFRETSQYLIKVTNSSNLKDVANAIQVFAIDEEVLELPYVKMWLLEMAIKINGLLPLNQARALCADQSQQLLARYDALLAKQFNEVDWVRARKESWKSFGSWEKRGIIWASTVLPHGERRPWLDSVIGDGDLLERSVAIFAKSS
jgi:hypothetical protein